MITTTLLIASIFFGILTHYALRAYEELLSMVFLSTTIIFSVFFIFFGISVSLKTYNYEVWVKERESFVTTLNNSRESGRELESAAIIREVAQWNRELASLKYDNKTILLDEIIDDRIEDLEPIK